MRNGRGAPIGAQMLAERKRLGQNQTEFYDRIGVTQSGGSRYEEGIRPVPRCVQLLFKLVYVARIPIGEILRTADAYANRHRNKPRPSHHKKRRGQTQRGASA